MKTIKHLLFGGLFLSLIACVDDKPLAFDVEKPASIAGMEYLNDYDVLKSYINSSANPDFKLGIALAANDYIAGGQVTQLANSNFVEMTAGNAMKYASCVADDGSMNFDAVQNFVSAAKAGGLTIYGHTLAWHAQQNNKYLNSLITPIIIPGSGNQYLHIVNPEKKNNWDSQFYHRLLNTLQQGQKYNLSFRARAESPFSLNLWVMTAGLEDKYGIPEVSISEEWDDYSVSFTPDYENGQNLKLVFGHYAGWWDIDNMVLTADGDTENLIDNGDFETGETTNWEKYSWHAFTYEVMTESGGSQNAGYCLTMTNSNKQDNNWGAQVWYNFASPLKQGTTYTFKCMAKATSEYKETIYLQSSTGGAQEYPGGFEIGIQWQEMSLNFTPGHGQVDKFTFNFGDFVGTIYIDNVSITETGNTENLVKNGDFEAVHKDGWQSWSGYEALSDDGEGYSSTGTPDQIIEKTPEEKKEIFTLAMNSWVEGMMKATGGYVTAWDVVNEAISGGGDDGEGFYTLQSAKTASAEDIKNNFYWQDYLGNEDYTRIVVAAARKYYAENGGTAPLKLFVNDYNLESDWDDNKKVKSLVHWIEKWEADGVTKIDGIGTQMHVSCYANAATQKSKEDHVVKMFEILAESGKLVKITELDMGYIDENGTSVKTENMTEAQHKAMSDYYKFIVKKYFEIIPAAQQYGITQWCATDSPSDSGWRGGEPVGLWDSNYSRKHTYAGFADGLAGK